MRSPPCACPAGCPSPSPCTCPCTWRASGSSPLPPASRTRAALARRCQPLVCRCRQPWRLSCWSASWPPHLSCAAAKPACTAAFWATRQPALCPDFLQRRRTPRPAPAPLNSSLVQLSRAVSPRALPIVHSHECLALPLSARVALALLPLCCHIVSPPNNSGMPACHAVCNATGVRFTLQMAAGKRMLGKGG